MPEGGELKWKGPDVCPFLTYAARIEAKIDPEKTLDLDVGYVMQIRLHCRFKGQREPSKNK